MSQVSDVDVKLVASDDADIPAALEKDHYKPDDVYQERDTVSGQITTTRMKYVDRPPVELAVFGKAGPLFMIYRSLKPNDNSFETLLYYQALREKILSGDEDEFTKKDITELITAKDKRHPEGHEKAGELQIQLSVGDDGVWVWAYAFKWLDDKFESFDEDEKAQEDQRKQDELHKDIAEQIKKRKKQS